MQSVTKYYSKPISNRPRRVCVRECEWCSSLAADVIRRDNGPVVAIGSSRTRAARTCPDARRVGLSAAPPEALLCVRIHRMGTSGPRVKLLARLAELRVVPSVLYAGSDNGAG